MTKRRSKLYCCCIFFNRTINIVTHIFQLISTSLRNVSNDYRKNMYPQKEVTFGKVLGGYVFIHVYTNVKPGIHARLFERDTNRIRGICKSGKRNLLSIINRDETARGEKLPEPNQFVHISMNSSSPKIASKISSNFFCHKTNGVQFLWKRLDRSAKKEEAVEAVLSCVATLVDAVAYIYVEKERRMECPEPMERGRNFRLLSEEELPSLLDFLAGYLPESLKFHQTLLTYMRDRVWDFHFYVANDWPESPICLHFPGMTLSPHGLLSESVAVFCPNDRLDLLKLVREEDNLIDWSKPLYINFVHHDIAEELMRLYEGTGTIERVVGDVCVCGNPEEIDSVEESDKDADPDIRVLPLKPEHAEGIHELYPANDMECQEVFQRLIRTLPAAGVFAKGKLAAWMVQSYYGAMFSMQTKPEYRRKGYGTKLARYLTKRVAEKGYQPFVVILPENAPSQSLYKKLGFGKLYQTVRMTFMPFAWQDAETESSRILRENLENAVRQLAIEHSVVDAFRNGEAGVTEKGDAAEPPSKVENSDTIAEEEPGASVEDAENPPEEETIDPVENNAGETIDDAANTADENGGGTDAGDAE